jgi:hypothetical protein
VLQEVGTYYVGHQLKGASATYGVFGLVLGLLAWIYLGALVIVMCAEFSVVRAKKLWPRSLLTPFTDNVRLTEGDRRAYSSYPLTEKHKGFETVDVEFHQPEESGEPASSGGPQERGEEDQPRQPHEASGVAEPEAPAASSGADQPGVSGAGG